MSRSGGLRSSFGLALILILAGVNARAGNDPAVMRGVQFLRSVAGSAQVGETALVALALIKADVPPDDPAVVTCLNKLRARFNTGAYLPERGGGPDIYEAGVVAMALSNADARGYKTEIEAIARFLIGRQNASGSWDYAGRSFGDTSISQYAVLGLWEADNAGARVPPDVWDRAARWYVSTQSAEGSWTYHRDAGGQETVAMTAAGTGSLLICQRQLGKARLKVESISPLLTPVGDSEAARSSFTGGISTAALDQAIRRGLAWIGSNFTTASSPVIGPSAYYALYGIERIGALADRETLGRVNWYEAGRAFIYQSQQGNGSWNASFGVEPNTVWAILFITKSTAKTLNRIEIKRLGAGTLLGGRGLPNDLTSLTVAGGRIVSRPMNGAVEGMLAVLEDPRTQNADAALAGLVTRYQAEGPPALQPQKDRFRRLLTDRDPGLRRVAAWALGRTGDLDAVPPLTDALTDPDQEVVDMARLGLQLLSRKVESLGPPSPSTPEQRHEAARRWRAWYQTVRPLDVEDETGEGAAAAPTPIAPAGSVK
jgi:hypothetical protein